MVHISVTRFQVLCGVLGPCLKNGPKVYMGEDLPKVKQVSLRPSPKSSPGKVKVQ
jgi:hypothetical protein